MRLFAIFALAALSACSTTYKPCTNGGEVIAWDPPLKPKGNKTCYQRHLKDGSWMNHGKYFEYFPSGKIDIEGEFLMGKRTGTWIRYDESGKKIGEKFYEKGKEVSTLQPPPPAEMQKNRQEELKRLGAAPPDAVISTSAAPSPRPSAAP